MSIFKRRRKREESQDDPPQDAPLEDVPLGDVPPENAPPQDVPPQDNPRDVRFQEFPTDPPGNIEMVNANDSSIEEYERIDDANMVPQPTGAIGKFRAAVGRLVNNGHFQNVIVALILINAVMMGAGTFKAVKDNPEINNGMEWADQVFLIIFTIELVLQFIFNGFHLFFDGWLVFDFVIVLVSWSLQGLQIIRAFRVFRALRLVTRIESLQNLVVAIISVMPRMFAIICLMALIFYIFAVMFTQLFRDLDLGDTNYFGSMEFTMLTLFQLMTLEWSEVTRNVMAQQSFAWLPILSFILISSFIVYNLVVAVVCDSIFILRERTAKKERKESDYDPQKVFAKLSDQVDDLHQAQSDVQIKLEQLALVLRDLGAVKIRK